MKKRRLKKWVENSLDVILVILMFALFGEIEDLTQFIIVKSIIITLLYFVMKILKKYEAI